MIFDLGTFLDCFSGFCAFDVFGILVRGFVIWLGVILALSFSDTFEKASGGGRRVLGICFSEMLAYHILMRLIATTLIRSSLFLYIYIYLLHHCLINLPTLPYLIIFSC